MPYAPGIQSIGGELIGRGIEAGHQNIFRVLATLNAQSERDKEQAKADAKERSHLLGIASIHDPENKDRYAAMGLNDLRNVGSQIGEKYNMQKADEESAKTAAVNALTKQHTAYYDQLSRASKALESFGRDLASGPQAFNLDASAPGGSAMDPASMSIQGPGTPTGPTASVLDQYKPRALMDNTQYALDRNPAALAAPQFDNSMQALERLSRPGKGQPQLQMTKGPNGESIVTYGNTVNVGKPATPAQINAVPVMADGQHVGYNVDGKFVHKDDLEGIPANAELEQAKTFDGKPIPGMYRDRRTGKMIKQTVNPFEALMQMTQPAPTINPGLPAVRTYLGNRKFSP